MLQGTNSEQDTRFSDKQKKLLRTMKFADVLTEKVRSLSSTSELFCSGNQVPVLVFQAVCGSVQVSRSRGKCGGDLPVNMPTQIFWSGTVGL